MKSGHKDHLKLYSHYQSSAAYRLRIALNIKGISFDTIPIDLDQGAQFDGMYHAINPQQMVPALEISTGQVLTQTPAIMEYLEEAYPNPAFLPDTLDERTIVRMMASIITCDIQPINSTQVTRHLQDHYQMNDGAVADWLYHWLDQGFHALDEMVAVHGKGYSFGTSITMADICLLPQWHHARLHDLELSLYPNLQDVVDRLEQHPDFAAAHPDLQPDAITLMDRQTMVMTMH